MNDLTASNGVRVTLTDTKRLTVTNPDGTNPAVLAVGEFVDALDEFFQAGADERLGRWRWPENPEYVVYAHRRVLHEATGGSWDIDALQGSRVPKIARVAWDAWHDVRFPKPWREAKNDEVWAVTRCGGAEHPMVVEGDAFVDLKPGEGGRRLAFQRDDKLIQRAHRIWPEESK